MALADAFATYKTKLQYPVTLQVNVKNLFDKTYYTLAITTNNRPTRLASRKKCNL